MRFIGFEREDEAEAWARRKLKLDREPEFFRAISSVDDNNDFVCVAVLTNFTSRNVDINIVIEHGRLLPQGTIEMYNGVFGYLFDTLKVPRLTGLVADSNVRSQVACRKFGFKLEGVMRKALKDDEDLMIYGMLADEYHQHNWYRK